MPLLVLGRALRRRGHDVVVALAEVHEGLAQAAGLASHVVGSRAAYDEAVADPDLWHPRRSLSVVARAIGASLEPTWEAIDELHRPGRTVVVGTTLAFAARVYMEANHVPGVSVHLSPSAFRPLREPPAFRPGRPKRWAPLWTRRLSRWAIDRFLLDPALTPALDRFRAAHGLGPVHRVLHRWMHAPELVLAAFPPWFGAPQPDWPAQTRAVGFLREPSADDLAPATSAFLDAGDAPIVFTAGTANRHAAGFFVASVEATSRIGRRAVLVTAGQEEIPESCRRAHVHVVAYAPFSRLFPRAAAIVHHGGIGTAAEALAAGVPQITTPYAFDQADNTDRLVALGVARWVLPTRYDARRAADALEALLGDDGYRERAARLAPRLADGADAPSRAADAVEALLG